MKLIVSSNSSWFQVKMQKSSWRTTSLVILVIFLLWMDACLYYQIQSVYEADYDDGDEAHCKQQQNIGATDWNEQLNQPHEKPFANQSLRVFPIMDKFSFAFQGMSVKLMMTDPVDNYLLAPLSEAFADMVDFKNSLPFITANMVSCAGVVAALIAAKLVSHDSLTLHRLSYVMFQVRTWLDDLDGAVARLHLGIHKHVSLQHTSGYIVDGVCDAIGFVGYIIGCYIFMKNNIRRMRKGQRQNRYNLKSITEVKSSSPSTYIPLDQEEEEYGNDENRDKIQLSKQSGRDNFKVNVEEDEINSYDDDDDDDYGDDEEGMLHNTLNEVIHHDRRADEMMTATTDQLNQRNIILKGKKNPENDNSSSSFRRPLHRTRIFMDKIQTNGKHSHLIYRFIKEKIKNNLNNRHLVLLVCCFLLQLAMCATFWNRYILVYKDLLESPSASLVQQRLKRKILRSNIMYIIIWFWRLTNGHSMMQMLIASVFFGKLWKFLEFIKYIGFVEITLLAIFTELHTIDIRRYLTIE